MFRSREMANVLSSSQDVALSVTGIAMQGAGLVLHIACLPVTGPVHIVGSAADLVVMTVTHVASCSISTVNTMFQPSSGEVSASFSPIDALVHHVSNAVPMALNVADGVKNNIGSILMTLVSPIFGGEQSQQATTLCSAGESTSEKETTFLDRLRIDAPTCQEEQTVQSTSSSDFSKSLLRVNDLNIVTENGEILFFIDLSPAFSDEQLSSKAFEALLVDGWALASIGTEKTQNKYDGDINWKPEGATRKLLKTKDIIPPASWYALMEQEVLIWSGVFNSGRYRDLDAPLFLSRGIVPGSPRDLFDLLCDSTRTAEYNRFCLGRSDVLVIDEHETSPVGKARNIKIVKSETRVPLTSLSVVMSTLMYGCELDDDDSVESYIIVSRSLESGGAGCHSDFSRVERDSKNEITWGVNLMRAVPDKPGVTDLVNISQVSSSFVPRFLTHRVGIMAVENSFNAMRSRDVQKTVP